MRHLAMPRITRDDPGLITPRTAAAEPLPQRDPGKTLRPKPPAVRAGPAEARPGPDGGRRMSDDQTPPEEHNALTAFAALTVFLAAHPELATLPLRWSYEVGNGITISLPHMRADTRPIADQLATVLGSLVHAASVVEHEGQLFQPLYLHATVAGIPVFVSGHAPADENATE